MYNELIRILIPVRILKFVFCELLCSFEDELSKFMYIHIHVLIYMFVDFRLVVEHMYVCVKYLFYCYCSWLWLQKEGFWGSIWKENSLFSSAGTSSSLARDRRCRAWSQDLGWPKAYLHCWIHRIYWNSGKNLDFEIHLKFWESNRRFRILFQDTIDHIIFSPCENSVLYTRND